MSILFRGKTMCPLCGIVIDGHDEAVLLPAFLWDEDRDPLAAFNDAALHRVCFERDPRHGTVVAIVRELLERTGPGTRKCAVCGEEIEDPGDYIMIPPMKRDSTHPLYDFRYTHLHKSHVTSWRHTDDVLCLLREVTADTKGQAYRTFFLELGRSRHGNN